MTGKTHQILGLSSGITYVLLAQSASYAPATLAATMVAGHLAALVPDLDESTALIWDKMPFGHVFGGIADPFIKHRNFTHSILGIGLFAVGAHWIYSFFPSYWGINSQILFFGSVISYASHIIADMFTQEGVPLFFPFSKMIGIPPKPLDGIRIQTGEWFENLVVFPALNLYLVIFVVWQWDKIKIILFK